MQDCNRSRSDSWGGESILGIDKHTGLPRLAIELPPEDVEQENLTMKGVRARSEEGDRQSPKVSGTFSRERVNSSGPKTVKQPQFLGMGKRSRSVFIRLQVPQKTPPTPHRTLQVVGEVDGLEEGIQTAPIMESSRENHFDFRKNVEMRRHSSESTASQRGGRGDTKRAGMDSEEEEESMDEVPANLPQFTRRPSSILYLSDTEDEQVPPTSVSRTSSMGSSHVGDETYITPFAQILANLHRVRSQFLTLMGLPDDVRTSHSHSRSAGSLASYPSQSSSRKLTEETTKQLAWDTLEELDWCLKKLESVDSAKSMGIMAQDKFRRILFRELSNLSEKSKTGSQVAEWVQNITSFGENDMDRTLGTSPNTLSQHQPNMISNLSSSMAHDEWKLMNKSSSRKTRELCERVPTFGVVSPKMDMEKMREFMNKKIDVWGADTFHLSTISGGNPLVTAAYTIFKKRKLFASYKISPPVFVNFMMSIQDRYHPNPYHNKEHAADVLIATNFLLKAKALEEVFTELEVLAVLVAAAVHDVDHPGRNNLFMVNTGHELALLYNDNSVLENHHLAVAFKTMQAPNCNFLENMEMAQRHAFRRMVIDVVLATDMARHLTHLGELKTLLETKKVANEGILVLDKYKDRLELLKCLIHCADLNNPTKPEYLAAEWAHRVMEEAFLQGDDEKKLGIPLNPLGDRDQVCFEKCQVTFIDFIVYPLWETWAELVYPDAQDILENISKTREFWNSQLPNSPPPTSSDSEDTPTEKDQPVASPSPTVECSNRTDKMSYPQGSFEAMTSLGSPRASERRLSFKALKHCPVQESNLSQDEHR